MGRIMNALARFSQTMDLPADAVLEEPKLTVFGGREASIDNHKGLLEYSDERIVVLVERGSWEILGRRLRILSVGRGGLQIAGVVSTVSFRSE